MQNFLRAFRSEYGWSQDAIAAALNVSPKTISRWELSTVPELNPFMKLAWTTINRYSHHLYRYAHAIVPASYIEEVRHDDRERSLLVGPEAVVLAMSDASRSNWGIFRHAEGMSIAAFIDGNMKTLLAPRHEEIKQAHLSDGPPLAINMLSAGAPLGSRPPLWRRHIMTTLHPFVFDLISYQITESEYASSEQKIWITDADVRQWRHVTAAQ